jgi:hypothetical protein
VPGEYPQPRRGARFIYVRWRPPAEHVGGPFGQRRLEPERLHERRDRVAHDQLRVPEDSWPLAKEPLDQIPMQRDLFPELGGVGERREAMIVRLAEELDAAGRDQRTEAFQRVARVRFELLDQRPAQRHRDFERAVRLGDESSEQRIGRDVASLGDTPEDVGVLLLVEVARAVADVEHPERAQPIRLVDLEVAAHVSHG